MPSKVFRALERNPLVPRIERVLVAMERSGELRAQFRSVLAGATLALASIYLMGVFHV